MKKVKFYPILLLLVLMACSESHDNKSVPNEADETEVVYHHPENVEIQEVVDTLLGSTTQTHLKVQLSSLENEGHEKLYEYEDGAKERHYFHDYELQIEIGVSGDSPSIYKLRKENFPEMEEPEAVIQNSWLESYNSQEETAILLCTIFIPDTDIGYLYELLVNAVNAPKIGVREIM